MLIPVSGLLPRPRPPGPIPRSRARPVPTQRTVSGSLSGPVFFFRLAFPHLSVLLRFRFDFHFFFYCGTVDGLIKVGQFAHWDDGLDFVLDLGFEVGFDDVRVRGVGVGYHGRQVVLGR